jgi:valyl-tRNA synthetase
MLLDKMMCGCPRCPTLQTAISDIEVETVSYTKETLVPVPGLTAPVEFGVIYRLRYEV